jgi:hypothetical protein
VSWEAGRWEDLQTANEEEEGEDYLLLCAYAEPEDDGNGDEDDDYVGGHVDGSFVLALGMEKAALLAVPELDSHTAVSFRQCPSSDLSHHNATGLHRKMLPKTDHTPNITVPTRTTQDTIRAEVMLKRRMY